MFSKQLHTHIILHTAVNYMEHILSQFSNCITVKYYYYC